MRKIAIWIIALTISFALAFYSSADAQVVVYPQGVVSYNFQVQAVYPRHFHRYHRPRYVYPRYYGYYYQTQPYWYVQPRVYNGNVRMNLYYHNGYLLPLR